MIPELFKIGPLTVYSYGLMLGIAFIVASYILASEFERKLLDKNFATEITLLAIIFGIIGSKLFSLFESWDEFLNDPVGMIFNPGGLTFYGGLILAVIAIWIYTAKKKIPFFYIADATAPSLALAYGIGRIGCHLSGDGDYGIPTSLPWGVNYENGIVKPSYIFNSQQFKDAFPNLAAQFPNGVNDNTPLHPTPVYEFLVAIIIFVILWKLRKNDWSTGRLFSIYLILSGLARFLVEFIRLNPRLLIGLSEAQLISIVLILTGLSYSIYFYLNPNLPRYSPPQKHQEVKKRNKK
jgi:phosphatidylglycerol:prolipoprotein diacylglycerol transferase